MPKMTTKHTNVARPRRHPRFANQFTAGSTAKDRKSETAIRRMRPSSFSRMPLAAMKTKTENATATTARQNHFGSARSPTIEPIVGWSSPTAAGVSGGMSVTRSASHAPTDAARTAPGVQPPANIISHCSALLGLKTTLRARLSPISSRGAPE